MSPSRQSSFNVYKSITDSIVAAIAAGAGPVEMPWHRQGGGLPCNAATGKRYRGVNVVALWAAAARRGFARPLWATYRQWKTLGAQVRGGEKGSVIVFYRTIEVEEPPDQTGEKHASTRLIARASWVFNVDQVDGYQVPAPPAHDPVESVLDADAFVNDTGAEILYWGNAALYSVADDLIMMPEPAVFIGTRTSTPTESWYGVLFHELVHWSGADHRLARDLFVRFGSDGYAMEELIAELGAAYLCAAFAISPSPRPDHAAYISDWLNVLRADNRAIFSAASKAAEAADYLMAFTDTGDSISIEPDEAEK